MSHLLITINNNGEIIYSKNYVSRNIEIDGVLGEYSFTIPSINSRKLLTENIKAGTKIFETSSKIYFIGKEHKHKYGDGSLCMIHKSFWKTQISAKYFIEKLLINYIAGYYNFREKGFWFNEHNGNVLDVIRKDKEKLIIDGISPKINMSKVLKSSPITNGNIKLKQIRDKKWRKNVKQIKRK